MTTDVDMSKTVDPKSDQLNSDDLIAGPRTIRITKVTASFVPEQPVSVHYDGDGGRPWKPCKSMRRVLIALWGSKGSGYVGKRLTLYRDENVKFGGIEVGGIRISHADIDSDMTIAITESRAKRKPTRIRKLSAEAAMAEEALGVIKNVLGPSPGRAPIQPLPPDERITKWQSWATKNNVDMAAVLAEMGIASLAEATDAHWADLRDYAKNLKAKA